MRRWELAFLIEQNRTITSVSIINHWGTNLGKIRLNIGLPWCSVGNESSFNVGDVSLIPGLGRPSGGGNSKHSNPLHYSCLENAMDRGYIPWGHKEPEPAEHTGWIWGCCPWGHKESDMTEQLSTAQAALVVKNLPAKAWDVRDGGSIPDQKDHVEEGTATHSSVLAWGIPLTEEPGGLWLIGSKRVGHDLSNLAHTQAEYGILS